jgi:hypothetical protein
MKEGAPSPFSHPDYTHATTGEPYARLDTTAGAESEFGISRESSHEKPLDRVRFAKNLNMFASIHIRTIGETPILDIIDDQIVNELVQKIEQLSANDIIRNQNIDGVLIAQNFILEVSNRYKSSDGQLREGVSTDPDSLRQEIAEMAYDFSLPVEDIPPTVTYETLPLVDIEGRNTRLANRIVAIASEKFLNHPYFQNLELGYIKNLVSCLDVNITTPLIRIVGDDPSVEELDAYIDVFVDETLAEIDRDVQSRNERARKRIGNEEEYVETTPADIIKGMVVSDHDFLKLVAEKLEDRILHTEDEDESFQES